jgi:hypothetical protein
MDREVRVAIKTKEGNVFQKEKWEEWEEWAKGRVPRYQPYLRHVSPMVGWVPFCILVPALCSSLSVHTSSFEARNDEMRQYDEEIERIPRDVIHEYTAIEQEL